MKLWNGVFRNDYLAEVASANELTQQVTAQTLLRLYRNNEVRMSSVTVESLTNFLHSKGKQS
jgi:hypothetical protein